MGNTIISEESPAAINDAPAVKIRVRKCPKCGKKKQATTEFFDKKADSHDGLQSYCKQCKSNMHKLKRSTSVEFYIRHHFTTRIRDQLGVNCPPALDRKVLNSLFGWRMKDLKIHLQEQIKRDEGITLREALDRGYHIDHIQPLHSFKVTEVRTDAGRIKFKECWAISNLKIISATENLAKGGKV